MATVTDRSEVAAPALRAALQPASGRRAIRPALTRDAAAIAIIWLVSMAVDFFVAPNYDQVTKTELFYYTIYNTAVGAFIGFYLLDRLGRPDLRLFLAAACAAWLGGTLINEAVVEAWFFQTGPINMEGVYYGLVDALTMTAIFVLLRLPKQLRAADERAREPWPNAAPADRPLPQDRIDTADCFFVRVAGETRRIFAADLIYLEAEKDFTRLVCATGEHFVSESLKSLIERSSGFGIVRVHKSFAVNLRRVERMTRMEVRLGEHRVPVGRTYWEELDDAWTMRTPAAQTVERAARSSSIA